MESSSCLARSHQAVLHPRHQAIQKLETTQIPTVLLASKYLAQGSTRFRIQPIVQETCLNNDVHISTIRI